MNRADEELTRRLKLFFEFIKHGDAEHIAWLKDVFNKFWGINLK